MGAYLSEPITEKVSSDYDCERFACGASSMQGWRVSQEDSHNCIINFDENTSLFAVYDGHGGHEVAQYCSQKFPEFLKQIETYKNGDLKQALIDAFIQFDATIATPDVMTILKELAGDKQKDADNNRPVDSSDDDEPQEDVNNLCAEASMPIEAVIEKYQNQHLRNVLESSEKGSGSGKSPFLRAKKTHQDESAAGSSGLSTPSRRERKVKQDDAVTSNGDATDHKEVEEIESSVDDLKPITNGDVNKTEEEISKSPSKKGKEKAVTSPKRERGGGGTSKLIHIDKKNMQLIYNNILSGKMDAESSDDSDDELDDTFKAEEVNRSDDDDDEGDDDDDDEENEGESDWGEETSAVDSEENGEDFIDDEDDEDDEDDIHMNVSEDPGSDSGCTAVVALLRGNDLYVANAGDSRCIVCRNGSVIEMSYDHKPENDEENSRIVKAGGKVTSDGRVNGGLNLSRAIGDHAYKKNKDLPAEEQMITALPDVKYLQLCTDDDFMVLACDGIWNFMSNEEVIEFVAPRLYDGRRKISEICEEMFDHCLAPNTMGDGTGCDNMTAIIVQFKQEDGTIKIGGSSLAAKTKRSASTESGDDENSVNAKRVKIEHEHCAAENVDNQKNSQTEQQNDDGGGSDEKQH